MTFLRGTSPSDITKRSIKRSHRAALFITLGFLCIFSSAQSVAQTSNNELTQPDSRIPTQLPSKPHTEAIAQSFTGMPTQSSDTFGTNPAPLSASGFEIEETTIGKIHAALRNGDLTVAELVAAYIRRIEAYDQPTRLNSLVLVNKQALLRARELDAEFARTGVLRPLHGIPLIVKDNYDVEGLPTTAGSLAMKGSFPPEDAFQIKRLREAGAIFLAKSNMAEWAFNPYVTVSSIAGITRNPYDLSRVPAGSSGGTAAAVAANLGAAGLGTDTGNSIRGPSSHTSLVGIRSTMGATSRDGIVPLSLRNDIGGPMARSVEDAVRLFEVIVGRDSADSITERSTDKVKSAYQQFLQIDGLRESRLGVFRYYLRDGSVDARIRTLTEQALLDLNNAGAEIVDPFEIPRFRWITRNFSCNRFRYDVDNYLASLGASAPYSSIQEIFNSGLYSPYVENRIKAALKETNAPADRRPPCEDVYTDPRSVAFRQAVEEAMDAADLDAIIYPTWSYPPRKVGDMKSPAGDNSQILAPASGFPAITVPIGFVDESLPAGITFVGRAFSEPQLISFAYAYEQATRHRRPPVGFGPIQTGSR
ncbi:MAG: amidase family protein [Pseudomonadota bacterium]